MSDDPAGNNNLTLHSLKKRASMKEKYNSFRTDNKSILPYEERHHEKEKSAINFPQVNTNGKLNHGWISDSLKIHVVFCNFQISLIKYPNQVLHCSKYSK